MTPCLQALILCSPLSSPQITGVSGCSALQAWGTAQMAGMAIIMRNRPLPVTATFFNNASVLSRVTESGIPHGG